VRVEPDPETYADRQAVSAFQAAAKHRLEKLVGLRAAVEIVAREK